MIHSRWKEWLALFLVLFAYAITLWGTSVPFTGDQKVYISIAAEMKERGEWLIPYLFEKVNFLKPPFQYWMTMGGWSIFGFNSFGTFFPSVVALVGCAFLAILLSPGRNVLVGLMFSATLGTLTYGTTAQMEIWITLFYLLSWNFFLREKMYSTFAIVGVMAWIKGPLYPVIWCLSALFYLVLCKDTRILKTRQTWLALLMGAAIGLSWYLAAYWLHPEEVLNIFFKRENFEKIQTSQGSMVGLWGDFTVSLMPIFFWLLMSINRETLFKSWAEHKQFWVAFGLIFFLFFSLFPYRVGAYLYPLTPLMLWIFGGNTVEKTRWVTIIQFIVILISFILIFFLFRLFWGDWIPFVLFIPFSLVIIAWAVSHYFRNPWAVALSSLAFVICIRFSAISIGESDIAGLRAFIEKVPEKKLAYVIDHEDIWHEWGWISVATERHIERLMNDEQMTEYLSSGGAVILNDEQQTMGVGLKCVDWVRMKRRMKLPLEELIISGLKRSDPTLLRTFRVCSRRQE